MILFKDVFFSNFVDVDSIKILTSILRDEKIVCVHSDREADWLNEDELSSIVRIYFIGNAIKIVTYAYSNT